MVICQVQPIKKALRSPEIKKLFLQPRLMLRSTYSLRFNYNLSNPLKGSLETLVPSLRLPTIS